MPYLSQERQTDSVPPIRSQSRRQRVETSENIDIAGVDQRKRKASLLWLFTTLPFLTLASSALVAPRIAVYTILVCRVLRPEYSDTTHIFAERDTGLPYLGNESLQSCATDPIVQVELAKLVAVLTMSSGAISCITTSWWSSFSDRRGRNSTLGISVFGLILSSINLILVFTFAKSLPGNYWFLLVGVISEALLGGIPTIWASVEASVVDCTDSSSRSRKLSLVTGILAAGGTLGPTFGSVLIHISHQVLSVFYVSMAMLLCYVILALTLLPESLSKEQMLANRNAYAERQQGPILETFLTPLTMFLPTRFENAESYGRPKRDWNITVIGIVYGVVTMILIPVDYLFQYTSYVFGWTGETSGYWLSSIGMTRAIFCLLVLPVAIAWLKRKSPRTSLPIGQSEPLHDPLLSEGVGLSEPLLPQEPILERAHTSGFDLSLARVSLLIYVVSYVIMGLTSNPWVFTTSSMLAQFGAGYLPGLHSMAMEMFVLREYRMKGEEDGGLISIEIGKLYGSLAVIQAFCSLALGPGIFALIFMVTVDSFPAAIFVFIFVGMSTSIYLLGFVRFPRALN